MDANPAKDVDSVTNPLIITRRHGTCLKTLVISNMSAFQTTTQGSKANTIFFMHFSDLSCD